MRATAMATMGATMAVRTEAMVEAMTTAMSKLAGGHTKRNAGVRPTTMPAVRLRLGRGPMNISEPRSVAGLMPMSVGAEMPSGRLSAGKRIVVGMIMVGSSNRASRPIAIIRGYISSRVSKRIATTKECSNNSNTARKMCSVRMESNIKNIGRIKVHSRGTTSANLPHVVVQTSLRLQPSRGADQFIRLA